jgi:hypothetical protein
MTTGGPDDSEESPCPGLISGSEAPAMPREMTKSRTAIKVKTAVVLAAITKATASTIINQLGGDLDSGL